MRFIDIKLIFYLYFFVYGRFRQLWADIDTRPSWINLRIFGAAPHPLIIPWKGRNYNAGKLDQTYLHWHLLLRFIAFSLFKVVIFLSLFLMTRA